MIDSSAVLLGSALLWLCLWINCQRVERHTDSQGKHRLQGFQQRNGFGGNYISSPPCIIIIIFCLPPKILWNRFSLFLQLPVTVVMWQLPNTSDSLSLTFPKRFKTYLDGMSWHDMSVHFIYFQCSKHWGMADDGTFKEMENPVVPVNHLILTDRSLLLLMAVCI